MSRTASRYVRTSKDANPVTDETRMFAFGRLGYRGYVIRHSALRGSIWIEKEGAHICHASDVEHAKRMIDELV